MDALRELGRDYWEWLLANHPTYATFLGDHRYDHLLEDLDEVARRRDEKAIREFLGRLTAIDTKRLSKDDRISAAVLKNTFELSIEAREHEFHQWAIDQMSGPQVDIFELLNWHPTDSEQGLNDLLTRFESWPRFMLQYLENLREGVAHGRTAPKVAVDRVKGQVAEALQIPIDQSHLVPKDIPPAWKYRFTTAIKDHIYPSFESFAAFLDKYPARDAPGMSAMPGGTAAYAFLVRDHTTTDLTSTQIHRIGLEELKGIHAEMRAIAKVSAKEYLKRIHTHCMDCYKSREEILTAYRAMLQRCWEALPPWFGTLPKRQCDLKPVEAYREKDAPGAYYYPPPDTGSRPGVFYINTYKPEERPRFETATLTVHEAVPGHHLQTALAAEQRSLPPYRRHGHFTAYVEGWALYAERLGDRMGLFRNDHEQLGMLAAQAFRASRLVVDTGLHAFGWSRERAFAFLQQNAGLSNVECANEIDRYIIMPGQALAYMIGKRAFEACRAHAEQALGKRFDIRAFHDVVLLPGAMPLTTLHDVVKEWAAEQKVQRSR